MDYWSIDRLEGDLALCEDPAGSRQALPRSALPAGAREGDCFLREADGSCRLAPEETARRRRENAALTRHLLQE